MSSLARTEFRRRYFVLFRSFFGTQAHDFHALLSSSNAIVSGSIALAYLSWTDPWEPGDMDLYVGNSEYGKFIDALERDDLASPAVHITPHEPTRYQDGIKDVRRYITSAGQHLDVIRSATDNPAHPLLFFWTSIVVNFLTADGAVCVFPSSTLSHNAFVSDLPQSPKLLDARKKYVDRGFTFTEVQSWRPTYQLSSEDQQLLSERPALVISLLTATAAYKTHSPVLCDARGCVLAPCPSNTISGGNNHYSS